MVRPLRAGLVLIGLLFFGMLAGCSGGSNSTAPAPLSGVQGRATRGPIAPLSQSGQPNDAPLPGAVIVVQQQNGAEVARQTTDGQGNFSIPVSAGTYQVVGLAPTGSQGFPRPPGPQVVTVPKDQYVTVDISYDTGIR